MKKTLAILLSLLLCFGALPAVSLAEEPVSGTCGEGVAWEVEETADGLLLRVSGDGPMDDFPNGLTPWGVYENDVTALVVGAGVTELGDCAFHDLHRLETVTLPEGLLRIGARAFENCRDGWDENDGWGWQPRASMTEITIPASVESIGENAFHGVSFLRTVNYPADLDLICLNEERYETDWMCPLERLDRVFRETEFFAAQYELGLTGAVGDLNYELVDNEDVLWYEVGSDRPLDDPSVCDPSDRWCEYFYTLVISGEGAIPDFVRDEEHTDFRPWEFYRNDISRVEVREGVTEIGDNAFRDLERLMGVSLPEGLTRIGAHAFENSRRGFDFGEGWKPYDSIETIDIPSTVTSIGDCAFREITFLEAVNFAGDLRSVLLNEERYGDDNRSLPRLELFRRVFENTAFFDAMVAAAMQGQLTDTLSWKIEESEQYSYWAYNDRGNTRIEDKPEEVEEKHWEPRYILTITGNGAIPDFSDADERPWEYFSRNVAQIVFEGDITEIGDCAFREFNRLAVLELPGGLLRIGERAFENCRDGWDDGEGTPWLPRTSMTELTIPSSVTSIGDNAFREWVLLETVNYGGGDLKSVLVNEERYADWHPENWARLEFFRHVFEGSIYFNDMVAAAMQGQLTDTLSWKVEESDEFSYWAHNDRGNTRIEGDENLVEEKHWETRYILTVTGNGAIPDFSDADERPWEYFSRNVAQIVFDGNITSIGDCAFREFNRLAVLELPEGLLRIGERAFENCRDGWDDGEDTPWQPRTSMTELTIPVSVTSIGDCAFREMFFLETVNYGGEDLKAILLNEARYNDWGKEDWPDLELYRHVFEGSVFFDEMVAAFMEGDLGGVHWAITENDDGGMYWNDTGLKVEDPEAADPSRTHPETRYTLTFSGAGVIPDFRQDDEVFEERPWEYFSRDVSRVVFTEDSAITAIGGCAFREFNRLESVTLREGLLRIGDRAFENCRNGVGDENGWTPVSGLERIDLPSTVTYLGNRAFSDCLFLETVSFDGEIEDVCLAGDEYAEGWSPMERVFAVFIGTPWMEERMFGLYMNGDCGENVTWRLADEGRGVWVENETGLRLSEQPQEGEEPQGAHFERRLTLYVEGTGAMDDYHIDFEGGESVLPPWEFFSGMIDKIVVGAGVTHIGESAFRWMGDLQDVELPDTLESIGAWAFESCKAGFGEDENYTPVYGLERIDIPASVTHIGECAFANNDYLSAVNALCDLTEVCLAGDDYAAGWHPVDRVEEVFRDTPWFNGWFDENYMRGACGENVTWCLEDTGEGVWFWPDEGGRPVEDPEDYGKPGTAFSPFLRLVIEGEGDMSNFGVEGVPGLDYLGVCVREIEVREGVTAIGENAFVTCPEARSVSLPLSLESVGENAFGLCTNLETVAYAYPGDENDWKEIEIGEGNAPLLAAKLLLHVHTPGDAVTENSTAPTCTEDGSHDEVVCCTICGKELSRTHVIDLATGHKWAAPTYKWAQDYSFCTAESVCLNDPSHTVQEKKKPAVRRADPTCEEDGRADYYAVFESELFEPQQTTEILSATGHDYGEPVYEWSADYSTCTAKRVCKNDPSHITGLEEVKATVTVKEPTCTEDGLKTFVAAFNNKSYWGQTHTEILPALGHDYKETVTPPTCTEKGYSTFTCSRCADTYKKDGAAATGHTPGAAARENEVAPTCTQEGSYDEVVRCTVCKTVLSSVKKTVGKIAHTPRTAARENEVAPTCTQEGSYDEVVRCTVCNAVLSSVRKTVDKIAHTPGAPVKENETSTGYDSVIYCAVCKAELSREHVETAPPVKLGDVDADGEITAADARLALRRAVDLEDYAPGSPEYVACNVDKDDAVTAADARLILRAAVDLEDPTKW